MTSTNSSPSSGGDRAVSPVIGVALMIGIVVVLAGAIGFAVLDFGSDVGAEPQASVDVEQVSNNEMRVTWVSEGNSDVVRVRETGGGNGPVDLTTPGQSATIDFSTTPPDGAVSVVAVIEDNPENATAVIEQVEDPT